MQFLAILGLDNSHCKITADYVAVTLAGTRLYERRRESTFSSPLDARLRHQKREMASNSPLETIDRVNMSLCA